jgi:hypothetical protein
MARGVTLNATISARDAASKNINRVNRSLSGLGNTAKQIGSDFKRVALFTSGLAVAAGAFTAVAIKGAVADAAAQAKMMAVLKARGLATESVTKAIDAQISAAAKLGFTDDEVRGSVEASTRFTKDYTVAQKMQTVAMDLARATGMTLEDATLQVGKAYTGTGAKLFKVLGITNKNIKGQKALDAILGKTGGTAKAYGETTEGAFAALSIQAAELQESFGAAFLPAVTKLFIGLQPHLERFGNYIKAATPTIEKFTVELVDKFLAKLPGWIAAAEEKFPSILRQIGKFADDIKGVGKSADGLLGPGGSITLLVTGIGAAFGGLRGAIATNLLKGGVDPIKAYFISTVGAGVLQGVIDGMTKSLTAAAVTKFLALFKNIPVSVAPTGTPGAPGVPVPVKPGAPSIPPVVPAGGAAATTGLGAVAASFAAPLAVIAAGGTAMLGLFALGGKLLSGGKSVEEREKEWAEWSASLRPPVVNPMDIKYGSLPPVNTTVTVKMGNKGIDDVVSTSVTRLGIPGAPNKY